MPARDMVISALRNAMPALEKGFGVRSISIFGSVARGDDRPDSDVDVLVEFSRSPTLFTLAGLRRELSELLGRSVDLGTPDTLRPHLRDEAIAESIRVA